MTSLNEPTAIAEPALTRSSDVRISLAGDVGRRLDAVTAQWLLPVAYANPRILEMFRERDLLPYANQVPWAGEFAGKHVTCATQILRLTGNAELRRELKWFVGELISLQAEDGYLGSWPEPWRLRKGAPNSRNNRDTWDAWGHYHIMIGLLLWHELTGSGEALACVCRIADLLVRRFLHGTERLHDTGAHEMNQAPVHSLAMLYRLTGKQEYLDLGRRVVSEFELPPAGDYYREGLADTPFYRTPKPRWESLHPIMGLVELYYATGDGTYRQAFENLWWSMLEGDRHNNGGFTSGEKASGTPYDTGAIETCCTVAWTAMSVEMLKLTGNPIVADELELTLLNSGLGLMSPSGRWVTYNTPMDGVRQASAHSIVFQARPGSPELNCCSVNGPRLLGLVGEWALLRGESGEVYVNYYGAGTFETTLPSGQALRLEQRTAYPVDGRVEIGVQLGAPEAFTLALRIPAWSERTAVHVNGGAIPVPAAGTYLRIDRQWFPGDTIILELDMRLHVWACPDQCWRQDEPSQESCSGEDCIALEPYSYWTSIYRGPLLLTYDPAFNAGNSALRPGLDVSDLPLEPGSTDRRWLAPQLLLRTRNRAGQAVQLCDFASAGLSGTSYRSWLPVRFPSAPAVAFSRSRPLRSTRPTR